MSPAIPVGALVVVRPVQPNELYVGDVVTYAAPQAPDAYVTHRIVEIDGGAIQTKGDANLVRDAWTFSYASAAGKVALVVPFAGYALAWASSPLAHVLLGFIVTLAAGAIGLEMLSKRRLQRLSLQRGALATIISSLWLTSLLGGPGYTFAAYTANTTNNNNQFTTAASFSAAPTVVSISPADTATSVPTGTHVTVTFSEAMDTASTQNAFSVQRINTGGSCGSAPCAVAGAFSWPTVNGVSGEELVFTPSSALDCSSGGSCANSTTASYQVTVGTGAQASGGVHLGATAQATFQTDNGSGTIGSPQVVPPTSPSTGATGVKVDTQIQITFSQAMDASSTQSAITWKKINLTSGSCTTGGTVISSVTINSSTFAWSGASANILTFSASSNLATSSCYQVTVGTTAKDLYGHNLVAGSPASNAFAFQTSNSSSGTTAPSAPTVTSPTGAAWTTNSTYTIAGTAQANTTVEVLDSTSTVVASQQLAENLTTYSISTPLKTGTNTFTVRARIGTLTSAGNPTVTITRNDPQTNPGVESLSGSPTAMAMVWTFSGDANANATAKTCIVSGSGSCTPAISITQSNGQFAYTFGSLSNLTTYSVTTTIYDSDGFHATANCGSTGGTIGSGSNPPYCTTTKSAMTLLGSGGSGGSITSLVTTPGNATFATKANQEIGFGFQFDCGAGNAACSADVLVDNPNNLLQFNSATATCVALPAGQTGDTRTDSAHWVLWNGVMSSFSPGAAADGNYSYAVQLFNDSACAGTQMASSSGTLTVKNAGSVSGMTPPAGSVTLSNAGQSQQIVATIKNYDNNLVGDGGLTSTTASSPASNPTGAQVTFSATSSDGNGGFHLGPSTGTTSWTSSIGTSYTGTGGCSVAANSGQACVLLTIDSVFSHTITITATVSSQGTHTSVSSSTTVLDPPQPPSDLVLSVGSIRMNWKPSSTPNVAGYRVYLGHTPGQYDRTIDVGNTTTAHITDVDYGTTYYATVRAYTAEGLTSEAAPEGRITLPPPTATTTPTLSATAVPPTDTPTPTGTSTPTSTPSRIPTLTGCETPTPTPTSTAAGTVTPQTPTATPSAAPAGPVCTPTLAPTSTASAASSASAVGTAAPTGTPTPRADATASGAASASSPTPTATASSDSPTATPTRTLPSSTLTSSAPPSTPTASH